MGRVRHGGGGVRDVRGGAWGLNPEGTSRKILDWGTASGRARRWQPGTGGSRPSLVFWGLSGVWGNF